MVRWPSGVTRHRQVAVGAPLPLCSSSGRTPCAAMLALYSAPTASLPTMPTKATSKAVPGGLPPAAAAPLPAGPAAEPESAAALLPCARQARPFITLAALPPGTLQRSCRQGQVAQRDKPVGYSWRACSSDASGRPALQSNS